MVGVLKLSVGTYHFYSDSLSPSAAIFGNPERRVRCSTYLIENPRIVVVNDTDFSQRISSRLQPAPCCEVQ